MHLVPLRDVGLLEPANPELLRRTYSAYRHLNGAPYQLRPWSKSHAIDLDAVIDAALKNKDRLRAARDRRSSRSGSLDSSPSATSRCRR